MISNILTTSGDPNIDLLYNINATGKYQFYGFKGYSFTEDEASVVIKCNDIDIIIKNLQKIKKEIDEYNKMGS